MSSICWLLSLMETTPTLPNTTSPRSSPIGSCSECRSGSEKSQFPCEATAIVPWAEFLSLVRSGSVAGMIYGVSSLQEETKMRTSQQTQINKTPTIYQSIVPDPWRARAWLSRSWQILGQPTNIASIMSFRGFVLKTLAVADTIIPGRRFSGQQPSQKRLRHTLGPTHIWEPRVYISQTHRHRFRTRRSLALYTGTEKIQLVKWSYGTNISCDL